MSTKIFRSIMTATVAVLITALFIIAGALNNYYSDQQLGQLRDELSTAVSGVEETGDAYLSHVQSDTYRFTWIAKDGQVLYDTQNDASKMENHKERSEVKQALLTGNGESTRFSDTMLKKTTYYAKRLNDGSVLRVSVTTITLGATVLIMLQPFLLTLFAGILLAMLLAHRLSKRILEPINAIDLSDPLASDSYDELSPLLKRIDHQNREIKSQMLVIQRKQDEFEQIVKNMKEGLLLVDTRGRIVSINPSAKRIFGIESRTGCDNLIMVDRSTEVSEGLKQAFANGHHEILRTLDGRTYQIDISRISSSGNVIGAVLLLFDITERLEAESTRREFTANVSHELKTPLQSILGSAELMESGLVKPEDLPMFAGRIKNESARMVALINDIIRLSQLDEHQKLEKSSVDLYQEAKDAADHLQEKASAKSVELSVFGESLPVLGVPRLMQEILFNLMDNAIQYSKPEGGHVRVTTGVDNGEAVISVQDDGIGIPKEQQERIFERFYRVDKSHSRRSGGTGLGLSIVKHAVQIQGGRIQLSSEPDVGTTITVRFPLKVC